MRKGLFCLFICLGGFTMAVAQTAQTEIVAGKKINEVALAGASYISQNIPLDRARLPEITLTNIETKIIPQLPKEATAANTFSPDIFLTTAGKQSFATLRIPLYKKTGKTIEQLVAYDIRVTSAAVASQPLPKPTGGSFADHSVLASGSWYKLAIPRRGIYKIDYQLLQEMGINPASVNPSKIRIYGNGGTVMSETVSDDQPDDLIENAVLVHASGSSFQPGDYVLFYANGPILWEWDVTKAKFNHTNNWYEDQSYYFLNFDKGPGKRVQTENATGTATTVITRFNDYKTIDVDSFNLGAAGKLWWSNRMNSINPASLTTHLSLNLGTVTGPVTLDAQVGNVNEADGNVMKLIINNQTIHHFNLANSISLFLRKEEIHDVTFSPSTPQLAIQLQYLPAGTGSGYLDYLQFNYLRPLRYNAPFVDFRSLEAAALPSGTTVKYEISNAPQGMKVWDITDPLTPVALSGQLSGSTYSFISEGGGLKEFIAFQGAQFPTPTYIGPVANQDLHGLPPTDFLIITRDSLLPAAEALATFHRQQDGIKVTVATVGKIYNEFSSGGQDIAGIRNFIKMFYDRADNPSEMIKNVLMFGAASYDYKNRIDNNTNIVPTFETLESSYDVLAYSSDDFFALLDDGENINNVGLLDIGIGRIPSYTLQESSQVVDKIRHYASPKSFGPWKNIVSFVADAKDENTPMNHLEDCEQTNIFFQESDRLYNLYKIYCDAYPKVSSSGEARYPSVNQAINNRIFNGTFLMSYSGHGSPTRWSSKAILTPDDYEHWNNKNKLPIMITATCDFGRFDDPGTRSAGAKLILNPDGGSIAMITTTQAVYADPNTDLVKAYLNDQFLPQSNGTYYTIGEALMAAKNQTQLGINNNKFVILGDPALKLQMPEHQVITDSLLMDNGSVVTSADTIKALGRYILKGSVVDKITGQLLPDFNGTVFITIYDKRKTVQTINTTPFTTPSFPLQTNIVAKVKADVTDGHFSAHFLVPKDINFDYGAGKISYYANTDRTDANGIDTGFVVGGYNADAPVDNEPPVVAPYIDNDKFRNGGVTGPNPLLYVELSDESGINVSGNAIGHDLVAILDGDIEHPMIMNNYYQTLPNDYTQGYVYFPLYHLPDGEHTIVVKAWDAYNNSGEGSVTFVVKNQDQGFISALYNYPNPVTDITHFVFQHNQKGVKMSVALQIYTSSGRMVKQMHYQMEPEGNRTEIIWDGKGKGGAPLNKGIYFYRLHIKTEKGTTATAYQKLVLLR